MVKFICYIDIIRNIKKIKGALYGEDSFLNLSGWRESFFDRKVLDNDGKAIPWCTYSFIYFVQERLNKDLSVFEFGSGASTKWYATRCKKIISVENNQEWFESGKNLLEAYENVSLNYMADGENYFSFIKRYDEKFDIVIADCSNWGKYAHSGRIECIKHSLNQLTDRGIIVLDDSERYMSDVDFLLNNGWKKIDFYGMAPSVCYFDRITTIFYRENNCLNI